MQGIAFRPAEWQSTQHLVQGAPKTLGQVKQGISRFGHVEFARLHRSQGKGGPPVNNLSKELQVCTALSWFQARGPLALGPGRRRRVEADPGQQQEGDPSQFVGNSSIGERVDTLHPE